MATITVYLVRHGQTWLNRFFKAQGWSDAPLTPQGEEEATQAGKMLHAIPFTNAYASDTMRAKATAELILAQQATPPPLTLSPFFREQFFGSFDGDDWQKVWHQIAGPQHLKSIEDVIAKYGMDTAKDLMHQADPRHMAEDAATYWRRLDQGLAQLRRENPDGAQVLVVTHNNTIRSLVDRFGTGDGFSAVDSPKNGSVTQMQLLPATVKILTYNQTQLASFKEAD